MPNPTAGDLHVNVPLTNVSLATTQRDDEFVADKVFPTVYVEKQSDVYYEFDRGNWMSNTMAKRAPGAESEGDGYRVSNTPYFCEPYGLHKDIPDQIRGNADAAFSLDKSAAAFLAQKALISREVNFATRYMAAVWGTNITGVSSGVGAGETLQWNDALANPIEVIRAAKTAVKLAGGERPNTLVLTEEVWNALADHPDFLERIKGAATSSSPAVVLRSLLATLLEIDRVLVMGSVVNTALEGATAVNSFIGGKKALLVHAATSPGLMTPTGGYTFAWRGYLGGTSPIRIKRFRLEQLEVDRVEIAAAYDQKLTSAALGYFWDTIVA